jgi:transcriptional regulator with XRE-family HTH domain
VDVELIFTFAVTNVISMKERLAELMKAYGLTAGRFAEALGVQASSISHLLSGRNNPNFDFLVKLFERFPDVSPDWFLRGAGTLFRAESDNSRRDLFSNVAQNPANQAIPIASKDHKEVDPGATNRSPVAERTTEKTISQIIVFYSDGTFSSFREENRSVLG